MVAFFITLLIIVMAGLAGAMVWASSQPEGLAALLRPFRGTAPATDGPRLQATFRDGRVDVIPLREGRELFIGRERGNALVIDNHLVSRRHARIFYESMRWYVHDDDSANGTFVNGRPVLRCAVGPADEIEIGPARIRLILPGIEERGTPANGSPVAHPGPASVGGTGNTSHQLFGHFAVVRSLGEGGIGQVLLAQDMRNNRRLVALKLLNQQNDYLNLKFQQEGSLGLAHPHIAQVYETGLVEGRAYIAMEYVEGASLRKLLSSQPMDVTQALVVIGQVLQALEHAHSKQIVHRDIKPENIMISAQEGVKIIDFGIARVLSTVTRTVDGLLLGTPAYMSFEQAMGLPVNPTSDLYAVAIVLYEMLTSKVPFSSEKATEVVRQHQRAQPMPPCRLNSAIPAHVERAILRGLEKDHTQRHQSALAFAQELGCPLGQPLPSQLAEAARGLATPVSNESRNAPNLPTRMPAALTSGEVSQTSLRVQSGPRRGHVIPIEGHRIVGRNDIDPSDGTISRQHFRVERQNGSCTLTDTSSFGTVVDGTRLGRGSSSRLKPGSIIQIGQTILVFQVPEEPPTR